MKEALAVPGQSGMARRPRQMQFNSGDRAAAQKTLKNFLFQNPNHQRAKAWPPKSTARK
jgi:hypothetical protein